MRVDFNQRSITGYVFAMAGESKYGTFPCQQMLPPRLFLIMNYYLYIQSKNLWQNIYSCVSVRPKKRDLLTMNKNDVISSLFFVKLIKIKNWPTTFFPKIYCSTMKFVKNPIQMGFSSPENQKYFDSIIIQF